MLFVQIGCCYNGRHCFTARLHLTNLVKRIPWMDTGQNHNNRLFAHFDEVDMLQLCVDLWRKRGFIILCTISVLACGLGYVCWTPQVYKAEVHLLPPPLSFLSELTAVDRITQEDIFDQTSHSTLVPPSYIAKLEDGDCYKASPAVAAFDLTNQYLGRVEVKKSLLNSSVLDEYIGKTPLNSTELKMSVSLPDAKKRRNYTVVSIEDYHPERAAKLVNTWADLAMLGARDELVRNAQVALQKKIKKVDVQIEVKKKEALLQLDTELLQLKEARKIADNIGFHEPVDLASKVLMMRGSGLVNVMGLRSLYLIGSNALSIEIDTLENRKVTGLENVPGLHQLEEQRAILQGVILAIDSIQTAKIDFRAIPPKESIKPKRTLIIMAFFILGLMFGVFVALILLSVEKYKGMKS